MPSSVKPEMIQSQQQYLPGGEEIELQHVYTPSNNPSKSPRDRNDSVASHTFVNNNIPSSDDLREEQVVDFKKKEKKKDKKKESESGSDSSEDSKSSKSDKKAAKKKKKKLRKKVAKGYEFMIGFLDGFGESVDGPGLRKKTFMGAFLTTIMRIACIILIAYRLYVLIIDNKSQSTGSIININYAKTSNVRYMDVPTLQLRLSNNITFYENEEDGPSLQRIDIFDNYGYEKTYSTRRDIKDVQVPVPVTKSIFGSSTVNLNSFYPSTSPPYQAVEVERAANSSATLFGTEQNTISVLASMIDDPLKIIYLMNGVFDTSYGSLDFVNHTVHLYLRFVDDMTHIKPCQLHVGLVNSGVFKLIQDTTTEGKSYIKKELQSVDEIYMTTEDSLWDINLTKTQGEGTTSSISTNGLPYNVLYLSNEFTTNELYSFLNKKDIGGLSRDVSKLFVSRNMTASSFMDWSFLISYVNNFLYTENTLLCDDFETTVTDISTLYDKTTMSVKDLFPQEIRVIADLVDGTTETMYARVPTDSFSPKSSDFYLLLFGITGRAETVRVNSFQLATGVGTNRYNYIKMSMKRSGNRPVNFKNVEPQDTIFASTVINYSAVQLPNTLPQKWISQGLWNCPTSKYGDGFCDCECGFVNDTLTVRDIDCNNMLPTLFSGNNLMTKFHKTSCASKGQFCSSQGTCLEANYLKSSKPCYHRASVLGDSQIIGYFGSNSDYNNSGASKKCVSCLGDTFLSEKSSLSISKSKYMCQITPIGYIFGKDFFSMNSTGLISVWKEAPGHLYGKCLNIPIRVKVGELMFPTINPGEYYTLQVGDASSNQYSQTAYLASVGPTSRSIKKISPKGDLIGESQYDFQTVCVSTTEPSLSFLEMAGFGQVISSVSAYSNIIIVDPVTINSPDPNNTLSFIGRFPTAGAFKATFYSGDGYSEGITDTVTHQPISVDVLGVTDVNGYQILQLKAAPSYSIGLAFNVLQYVDSGRTIVNIEQFKLTTDLSNSNLIKRVNDWKSQPSKFKQPRLLIRKSIDDYTYLQYVLITDITEISVIPLKYRVSLNSKVTEVFDVGSVVEYTADMTIGSISIPITLSSSYDRKEFLPVNSAQTVGIPTPSSLRVQYAMFIVPNKKKFPNLDYSETKSNQPDYQSQNFLNLCPREYGVDKVSIPYDGDMWKHFSIDPSRGHNVESCKISKWTTSFVNQACSDVKNLPKNQFNKNCIKQMPPTYSLKYDHVIQLNNKWSNLTDSDAAEVSTGGASLPEFKYTFKHVYTFQHDKYADEVDSSFSTGAPKTGDFTQNMSSIYYNGKLNYQGRSKDVFLPANSPILDMDASIELSPNFIIDVLNHYDDLTVNYGWNIVYESGTWKKLKNKTIEAIQEFGDTIFDDIKVVWDLSSLAKGSNNNKLTLTPGHQYNFFASLKITTLYSTDTLGNSEITQVKILIQSTSVTEYALDFLDRQKCILNFAISFDLPQSYQVFIQSDYTILAFFTDVGGAIGIISIGAIALELWQSYIRQPEMKKRKRERMPKKLPKKELCQRLPYKPM
ncbi:predicted protein [Naegleria gruberi]|uniref:Predicted protein n=1 Tax=Naegleria gruberi TaxID=5762 RepID=D2V4W6_NAEGR|nr:uncharacterized protein NAEGRDRAFT_63931 [Naegleria gruberi]EFC48001.1 predicted protein [Naegleria gruberi]|eukprot:XP_002680745.1 predicted protein [Naegleria gruberi strain NEG-M]